MSLFRREVIEAKQQPRLGRITLSQPPRLWAMSAFAAVAAALVVSFFVLGEYSRRSRVVGQLVPEAGLITVVAPLSGFAESISPNEGVHVPRGAALVQIGTLRATSDGTDSLDVIGEALDVRSESLSLLGASQLAQVDAQLVGTRKQLGLARAELRQLESAIATRREQVLLGRDTVDRYMRIAEERFVSALQLDQQEQAVLGLVSEQQALERQATLARRGIAQIEQALRELTAQRLAQQAATRRDLAQIGQERVQTESNGRLLVKAPVAGLVATRLIEPGQAVQAGQALLTMLPAGSELQAQLLVPSRAVGFIVAGSRVLLRYQAYPHQKFGHHGGEVIRVSRSAMNPGESHLVAASGEPHYRVVVRLDNQTVTAFGKAEPLRPGMVLEADVLSERRKLYEWLLEPLYSLRGTTH